MIFVIIGVVVFVAGLGLFLVRNQRHHETGVTSFQRRIDALSPEARREVFDRIRPQPADRDRKSRP
jgi:hypothetical protein